MKGPHFFEKRKRELARQEKAKQKAERKAQRKADKDRGVDPDLDDPLSEAETTDTDVSPPPAAPDEGAGNG